MNKLNKDNKIKQIVKKHYGEISGDGGCCSCGCGGQAENEQIAKSIGYSDEEIKSVGEANLGLGCGNPTGMGEIKEACKRSSLYQENSFFDRMF